MRYGNKFRTEESGQTLVIAAVGMTVIIGFLGLSVDVGQLRFARRNLQTAADSAAVAAAMEIRTCGGKANCSAMQSAVESSLQENGFPANNITSNCGAPSATGLTASINAPACALGDADPNHGNKAYVEVVLTQPQTTYFARLLGYNNVPVVARAEAARSANTCIYALDPTGNNALTVDAQATLTTTCGVMVESSSRRAIGCNPLATGLHAPRLSVVGGAENFLCAGSAAPRTGATLPSPADPLASLPKPYVPACGASTSSPYHGSSGVVTIIGDATLYPDYAYCGGVILLPGARVTFEPGTYILTSSSNGSQRIPGGLSIDLGATVNGSGVTFYNYGPTGSVLFSLSSDTLGTVNLTAPRNGTYAGILFFQDPQNKAPATIIGNTGWNTRLEGTSYFPTARVSYGASGPASYDILIAYDIDFIARTIGSTRLTSQFSNNYASLESGSPVAGDASVLVQ